MQTIYWTTCDFDDITLHLAASDKGLCRVALPNESLEFMHQWVQTQFPRAVWMRDDEQLQPYSVQFEEYFSGHRRVFSLPLDMRGTPFQVAVWEWLGRIPYGEVWAYSDIAEKLGNPGTVRAVGAANGQNPLPVVLPCHRVIGKDGSLTGFRGGLRLKEKLLQLEGVTRFEFLGHAQFNF